MTAPRSTSARVLPARLALLGALALAGCSGDGGVVRGAAELGGFATTTADSKPFVREARPATIEYLPVGVTVTRGNIRKTPAEFRLLEAELEAKRQSNEAAGVTAQRLGRTPPPKPARVE